MRPCGVKALAYTASMRCGLCLARTHLSSVKTAKHLSVGSFRVIFGFLRCRWADARQREKVGKRRKGTLSGVCDLVNRRYLPV